MTSETETLKTNEFLRRRKLRLQQVREQSKDIAKKIRQRAKVETLRQVVDLDAKKQKEYFDRQEKLVKRLEVLYSRGLKNVGASHQNASEVTLQDEVTKTDLSKLRGKEATAELRKKRQEILDQQKKLLDRKLQAREAANEISREKSSIAVNKLLPNKSKGSDNICQKVPSTVEGLKESHQNIESNNNEPGAVTKNDMATQWDIETMPIEWEPAVPALTLPKDDQISVKWDEQAESKSDKSRRLDLFALSKEMPTDLRGRHVDVSVQYSTVRPSLTLISEYLQNRKLRLRETDAVNTNKKRTDDISSLKQTIQRTRTNKAEGSPFNACQVLDEQIVPVPSWRAEATCEFCTPTITCKNRVHTKQFQSVTNSQINRSFGSVRPWGQSDVMPSPVLRSTSPFRRNKVYQRFMPGKSSASTVNSKPNSILSRKNSVVMYNHCTRDTRDLPSSDEPLVVRDMQSNEDAYSLAMKEASTIPDKDKEHHKKVRDIRNKVAVTKQTVEKEYKDTISFLNSLPKTQSDKVPKTAYMDERRQQMLKENRQHKMQQEYRKIEKECRRHHSCSNKSSSKSRSPTKQTAENDTDRDFQYSWMPVPESDGNLAIHAISNTVNEGKSGNSVKFSTVDSYHEYRSRHKHTPPTKDTASHDKHSSKKRVETVIIDKNESHSSDESSTISNTSSAENLRLDKQVRRGDDTNIDQNLSDTERIIIYKILDSKDNKYTKKKNKLLSDIAKSLTSIEKVQKSVVEDIPSDTDKKHVSKKLKPIIKTAEASASFEQINEGVYKVSESRDNLTTMYFNDHSKSNERITITDQLQHQTHDCKKPSNDQRKDKGSILQWEGGDKATPTKPDQSCQCSNTSKEKDTSRSMEANKIAPVSKNLPSACTSTSSFKTATNDKASSALAEGGFIKLVDEEGQEACKFFLGSTGFLKDNAYEVVIQLRKKDGLKEETKSNKTELSDYTKQCNSEKSPLSNNETVGIVNAGSPASDTTAQAPSDIEIREVLSGKSVSEKETTKVSTLRSTQTNSAQETVKDVAVDQDSKDQNVPSSNSIDNEIHLVISSDEEKEVSNKGTIVKDVIPESISKFDILSRPATTTYTQTTNSPIHRPMYFHMSSSTSTAYMSPPEMILPKFLRPDSGLTEDETYGLQNINIIYKQASKNNKKCRNVKKAISVINTKGADCRKNKHNTPPSSATRSRNRHTHESPSSLRGQKIDTPCKTKCKCHNCGACIPQDSKDHIRKQCNRSKNTPVETYRSPQNFNIHLNRNDPTKNKYTTTSVGFPTKTAGANLNLIVRNYINKLLALNKEGLKALEVADQDCSSVSTPGSSIINVPCNVDERKSSTSNKISLEQIKKTLLHQIVKNNLNNLNNPQNVLTYSVNKNNMPRKSHRKPLHKVKSLNISKRLLKKHKTDVPKSVFLSTTDDNNQSFASSIPNRTSRSRPRSSPIPKQEHFVKPVCIYKQNNIPQKASRSEIKSTDTCYNKNYAKTPIPSPRKEHSKIREQIHYPPHVTITATSPDSELTKESDNYYKNKPDYPISMSTQTSQNIENDFVKLAEDKLQNMEKIADLTEKCTKRLSSLAKVLEEVRKHKSLIYSQISGSDSTDSQSDHKSDNVVKAPNVVETSDSMPTDLTNAPQQFEIKSSETNLEKENSSVTDNEKVPLEYVSILADIPKTGSLQLSTPSVTNLDIESNVIRQVPASPGNADTGTIEFTKCRPKPPPALSRIHLKRGQEYLPPHELSTVMEVDSPMSVKNKNQSARNEIANNSNRSNEDKQPAKDADKKETKKGKEFTANPDILQSNMEIPKLKMSSTESSDDSKFQMIDLKQFNEIMLEPFISIHEYAKKYNVAPPDDGSNLEDIQRDDVLNDDMSSLHSDGSLPDVIAELLKRNIISEPFKFDTASNVNSNTFSSESTLSVLALSKVRKARKRSSIMFQNKENIGETSDTLSISSNPDLENAFKKLGMGWASSTLKKTKERLALSSSSNTSSSSISQFKLKSFNQDIPALVTDSVSSVLLSKKGHQGKNVDDNSKHAEQQTSFANSMTVKEFLTNELANKITFTNKSGMNDTEEEFVSLFETKMPEGLKQQSLGNRDDQSNDSIPSGVNRARTSTPVQIFKSMTYHSSSSSNLSNGLFSNADDLSSVKMTSTSMKNQSTSDKDDLTIPNISLKKKKGSDCSKSD